ncbi:MAG: ArnT family glycosyltransferase [Bacteroidia bacterium]
MFRSSLIFFNKNLGLLSSALLLFVICLLPHITIWDEQWYMGCLQYIRCCGISYKFIFYDPAAPLHAVIYYILTPVTHGSTIGIRLVNFAMCLITCYFIYKTIQLVKPGLKANFTYSLSLFAFPSFFVIGFFAISEAPCLLFYCISLYLFLKSFTLSRNAVILILSGICLGFAIITRQFFLLCIMPPMLIIFYKDKNQKFKTLSLFFIAAIVICAPVYYIWKSIVPPNSGIHHKLSDLFTPKHLFLSFGYAFFYFLCFIPRYLYDFFMQHKKSVILLILLGILISIFIKDASFLPMSGFLPRFLSAHTISIFARLYFVTTCILGLFLFYFFVHEFIKNMGDFMQVFLLSGMFLILCSPTLISSQFSSRYPLQAAPLILIFCSGRLMPVNPKIQTTISIITILINLVSITTFFE